MESLQTSVEPRKSMESLRYRSWTNCRISWRNREPEDGKPKEQFHPNEQNIATLKVSRLQTNKHLHRDIELRRFPSILNKTAVVFGSRRRVTHFRQDFERMHITTRIFFFVDSLRQDFRSVKTLIRSVKNRGSTA